jgi:hypothetical protein
MNINDKIYYNPFAIETALQAYAPPPSPSFFKKIFLFFSPHTTPQSNSLVKIGNIASCAFYDITIKNPKDLIIGNAKVLIESSSLQKKMAALVMMGLGIISTLILYGLMGCFIGSSIAALGTSIHISFLEKWGNAVWLVGEKLLIAGGVPIYGVTVALPKKIIATFPTFFNFCARKIDDLCVWIIEKVLLPFWEHVLHPILLYIDQIVQKAYELCKEPLDWMVENMLKPVLTFVVHQLVNILEQGINILIKIVDAAGWIFTNIFAPPLQLLGKYLLQPIWQVASFLVQKTADVVTAIAQFVWPWISFILRVVVEEYVKVEQWGLQKISLLSQKIVQAWNRLFGLSALT